MKIFERLLEDYTVDTDIEQQAFWDKIAKGLVYWADLDLQDMGLDVEATGNDRINKTAILQNIVNDLNKLIVEDPLTGLFNRRYFNRVMGTEIERNIREHRPLSLAILDIDHFKNINDTWGHDSGDEVLRTLAKTMHKNVRQSDALIRIGGEEFAIVMPNVRHNRAKEIMERLRIDIENLIIPFNGHEINITASIGITVREPNQVITIDELYRQADQALYQAKETGRNKVVINEVPANTGLSVSEREELLI